MKASRIIVAALLTFAATSSQSQEASNFPQRPVRIIVNVAPGGGVKLNCAGFGAVKLTCVKAACNAGLA